MKISRRTGLKWAGAGVLLAGTASWSLDQQRNLAAIGVFQAGVRDVRHATAGLKAASLELRLPYDLTIRMVNPISRKVTLALWRHRTTRLHPTDDVDNHSVLFDLNHHLPLVPSIISAGKHRLPDGSTFGPEVTSISIWVDKKDRTMVRIGQSNGELVLESFSDAFREPEA